MHETESTRFNADLIVVVVGLAGLSAANLVAQAGRSVFSTDHHRESRSKR